MVLFRPALINTSPTVRGENDTERALNGIGGEFAGRFPRATDEVGGDVGDLGLVGVPGPDSGGEPEPTLTTPSLAP